MEEPLLHRAARLGDIAVLEQLIVGGADINARIDSEREYLSECWNVTPLMVAARSVDGADVATLVWLLEHGADLFASSDEHGTENAAWYAAGRGGRWDWMPWCNVPNHADRLRFLLDAGLAPTHEMLREACAAGDPARVQILLERGVSPHSEPRHHANQFQVPLFFATESGSATCVQLLLEAGANVNLEASNGETPLAHAGSAEVVAALLVAGANPNQTMEYNRDVLGCLLERAFGHDACHLGPRAAAQALLDAGISLDATGESGWSRLTTAAFRRQADTVDWLLERGAFVHKTGWTALHAVCWQGEMRGEEGEGYNAASEQLVRHLIAAGISPNARDNKGMTPLHVAVDGDWVNETAIRTLLELGAEVDAIDNNGFTALHWAAGQAVRGGTDCCIQLLLAAGADPLRPDPWGRSPLAVAEQIVRDYEGYIEKDEPNPGIEETPEARHTRYATFLEAAQKTVALLKKHP
ncbi:ankyrin repeat domain-containing protein [Armatimonas sp.]|uniref:ankyrin repeat domain-containing protein n=1 Tax=Armatimonas sp. TaxID=1872638 RepID=UPI0037500549